jgi:hypothetical protein
MRAVGAILGTAMAAPASAQVIADDAVVTATSFTPSFFLALIAGVILAYGIQLLLTTLSVALGLSMTPNLEEPAAKRSAATAGVPSFDEIGNSASDLEEDHATPGMKITSGLGLWAVISTSLALFAATWLAVQLSLSADALNGLILGLVIWAAFFMTMLYLEIKSISSLIGGLLNSALAGVRGAFGGLSRVISHSPEKQAELNARRTVRGIYEEVDRLMRKTNLDRSLENYLSRMEPKPMDYKRITRELARLINQIEVEERSVMEEGQLVRVLDLHIKKNSKYFTRENAAKLQDATREAVRVARENAGNARADQALAMGDRFAPMADEDARAARESVAEYLRQTGREELDPETLKADLERILHDPNAAPGVLTRRLNMFDRDTLRALIATHPSMDEQKADQALNVMDRVFGMLRAQHGATGSDSSSPSTRDRLRAMPQGIDGRLESFFNDLGRPELNYAELKAEVREMFEDPAHAPGILKRRLAMMDRDSLIALLRANPRLSEAQAEDVADRIIGVRDSVSSSLETVSTEVTRRYETLRRKAIVTAEHTRKNAIAASWWTLLAATLSAAAAASAGWMAAS